MSDLTKDWRTNDEQIVVDRLNAEIERLKREDKLNQSHNAEIERLKAEIKQFKEVAPWHIVTVIEENARLKSLITELADALTSQDRPATRPFLREDHELIQRARERVGKRPINP
jgi:hypothetical protein